MFFGMDADERSIMPERNARLSGSLVVRCGFSWKRISIVTSGDSWKMTVGCIPIFYVIE